MAKECGISGHGGMEGFLKLALQVGVLVDEIAAMPSQELQLLIEIGPGGKEQAEAELGGAEDGGDVDIIGLVARIDGLTELPGGVGMDEPGFEVGLLASALEVPMVSAGHFDGDD